VSEGWGDVTQSRGTGDCPQGSVFYQEAISKIPVVIKGRALAHLSKKKKSNNPQNSSLFLWFFDSFIFKICTKFAALLTKGVFEMASRITALSDIPRLF
jgi:hypothetical protein